MAKSDQRGRSKADQRHLRLPHLMTGSVAFQDLKGNDLKLLIAMQRLDNGSNNGNLFLSARKASEECGLSRNTVMQSLRSLEEHGFIVAMERGHFKVKGGPATRWRIVSHRVV
jgi:biotin operon repressor